MKKRILFFTNLHPLPWQPTRATYNYEEIRNLKAHANVRVLMPVPWFTWFKQVVLKGHRSPEGFCLFPFFYVPKILTSFHPLFLLISLIISVKPLIWLAKSENVIASWAYAEAVVAAFGKALFKYKLVNDYVRTKIEGEKLVLSANGRKNLKTVSLRPVHLYGIFTLSFSFHIFLF